MYSWRLREQTLRWLAGEVKEALHGG